MSGQAVINAVRDVVVLTPGMLSGYAGIPEKAPTAEKLPAGIVSYDVEREGAIVHGGIEEWSYPIRVDLLLRREGDLLTELPAAVALLEAFVAELRAHAILWGTGYVHADATWKPGQLSLHDEVYVGASWRGTVGAQFEVSTQIEP